MTASWREARASDATARPRLSAIVRMVPILLISTSGVQIDELADVDRQQETRQVGLVREEVALQTGEVAVGELDVAAQVGHFAQQVEGVLDGIHLAHGLGQLERQAPVARGMAVAAGLQMGEAEVET